MAEESVTTSNTPNVRNLGFAVADHHRGNFQIRQFVQFVHVAQDDAIHALMLLSFGQPFSRLARLPIKRPWAVNGAPI